jgi:hypothetical protein
MLGGLGPDEDIPPGPDDIQPHFFDFFGFGQPGHGPAFQMQPQQQQPGQLEQQQPGPAHVVPGEGWGLWPQGLDAQAQQDAVLVQPIPAAHPLDIDLNQPLEQLDNDLGVVENVPGPLQPPQQPAEAMDEDIIVASSDSEGGGGPDQQVAPEQQLAADQHEVNVFIPMDNGAPLQLIPDEIQEHELMGAPDVNVAGGFKCPITLANLVLWSSFSQPRTQSLCRGSPHQPFETFRLLRAILRPSGFGPTFLLLWLGLPQFRFQKTGLISSP